MICVSCLYPSCYPQSFCIREIIKKSLKGNQPQKTKSQSSEVTHQEPKKSKQTKDKTSKAKTVSNKGSKVKQVMKPQVSGKKASKPNSKNKSLPKQETVKGVTLSGVGDTSSASKKKEKRKGSNVS